MAITYAPTTNFGLKDSLPTNDSDKVIRGSEFTTEFTAIQTAFSLAAPVASPTFTGTVTIPTADINGGNIDGTVIGAATPAAGSFTTGQFGTSLNVDGTVTADGLTVDGAATLTGNTSPASDEVLLNLASQNGTGTAGNMLRFTDKDPTATNNGAIGKIQFYSEDTDAVVVEIEGQNADASPDGRMILRTAEGTTLRRRIQIANTGDISFYEDTGTTAKFFWDASTERLGIGTSSPSSVLTAVSGDAADEIVLTVGNDYSTADAAGDASGLMFQLYRSYTPGLNDAAFIKAEKEQAWDSSGDRDSALTFGTRSGGTEPAERMRIDSSGNLGLGVAPSAWDGVFKNVQIGGSGYSGSFYSQANGDISAGIVLNAYYNGGWKYTASSKAVTQYEQNNGVHKWFYAASGTAGNPISFTQAMTLDASGNLLVGKTSAGFANTGHQLNGGGSYAAFTRDGATPVLVNRKTSDGAIVEYMKDGTTVGTIGTSGSRIYIGGQNVGLDFEGLVNEAILPFNPSTVAGRDDGISLGSSSYRFKDLYLSGGVYLGGTGAANKLDDYEEGTFTPTLANGTVTYNVQKGWYTKIGRVVTVNILLSWTALSGSGSFTVSSLPFVPFNTDSDYRFTGSLGYTEGVDFGGREFLTFTGNGGVSVMNLYANEDNATPTIINVSNCSAIGEVQITTTYITNA